MGLKAAIFDFNGTLFWDTELHNRAWDIFLKGTEKTLSNDEKNEHLHGKSNKEIMEFIFGDHLSPEDLARLSAEKETIYQTLCFQTEMHLATGAEAFLTFLHDRKIPFAIATSSERFNVDFYLREFRLERFLDRSRIIYSDGTVRSKPSPELFLKAIKALNVGAEDTVIFEDSVAGIHAAEQAGAGRIVIVDSHGEPYDRWTYQKIADFREFDLHLFDNHLESTQNKPT